jgi:hypothetical protein
MHRVKPRVSEATLHVDGRNHRSRSQKSGLCLLFEQINSAGSDQAALFSRNASDGFAEQRAIALIDKAGGG